MQVIETDGLPIFSWAAEPDEETMRQTRNLARLPFAYRHIALMPDAHVGYGMPIGGILAAEGQVVPHAVGLDIGCGVRAWRVGIDVEALAGPRDEILHDIRRSVPLGFHWHERSQEERTGLFERVPNIPALRAELEKAKRQVGSLGGGNHFIELQADPEGHVWGSVHTGSRNVGKQLAEHYDRIAREKTAQLGTIPLEWGLAYLPIDEDAGREYLEIMGWCLEFAHESRRLIADSVQRAVSRRFPEAVAGEPIEVHHNYAAVEEHYGRTVVLHRKGAVRAVGDVVVPGSMGTASFVGRGLANAESFCSCSHGAGRAMSRAAARQLVTSKAVLAGLHERGIGIEVDRKGDIPEEAPEAYKDIDEVMRLQADLVEPVLRLRPLGVVKG